ncbi:MAG: acyltransferase family protein [Rikenellaceae bacterium]
MEKIQSRDYAIDSLKLLCAFLVITVHTAPSPTFDYGATWTGWLTSLNKVAVPCFFMISGFFIYTPDRETMGGRLRSTLSKVWRITLWSSAIYIIIHLFSFGVEGFNKNALSRFVFYNLPPFGVHLWYLFAYIYLLGILRYANRKGVINKLFITIPFLLLLSVLLGRYSFLIGHNHSMPIELTRNFFFAALPYFMLGAYLKTKRERIEKISRRAAIFVTLALVLLSASELWVHTSVGLRTRGDFFVTTPMLATSLLILFMKIPQRRDNIFSKIGRKDSLYIYIFHIAVIRMLLPICGYMVRTVWADIYIGIFPIVVFIISIAVSELFRRYLLPLWTK